MNYLLPPDQGTSSSHAYGLHKVSQHMNHSAFEVDVSIIIIIITIMLILAAVAVTVPWCCPPRMLMTMPATPRKHMSLPLTGFGLMVRCVASARRILVMAQLQSNDAKAASTSTRWYLDGHCGVKNVAENTILML